MINAVDKILINSIAVIGGDFYLHTQPHGGIYGIRNYGIRGTMWVHYQPNDGLILLSPSGRFTHASPDIKKLEVSSRIDTQSGNYRHKIKIADFEKIIDILRKLETNKNEEA